jgi:hypothetical protein
MQSEPSAVSPTEPIESNTSDSTSSTQHGLHRDDAAASLHSVPTAETGTATPTEQIAGDATLAASLHKGRSESASVSRRLSPKGTPSPPSGHNRITEYEQASTPPIRKKEGPGFEVIKKYRSPSDQRSPIQELPNGMSHTVFN